MPLEEDRVIQVVIYLFLLLIIYAYSYSVGGDTIMLFLFTLLVAPIISGIHFLIIRNKILLDIEYSNEEIEKDGVIEVKLTMKNLSFIPIPYINIYMFLPENFRLQEAKMEMYSLGPYEEKIEYYTYNAKRRGVSVVGLEKIVIRDFFNFFKEDKLKHISEVATNKEVTVIPRLHHIKLTTQILQTTSQISSHAKSEKQSFSGLNLCGEPGYELREFRPGDPLHKIHWKMSAKLDKLLIRKDECSEIAKKEIILDPNLFDKDKMKYIKSRFLNIVDEKKEKKYNNAIGLLEDKLFETLLAVCYASVSIGKEVELWLYEDGKWHKHIILDKVAVNELQHRLAGYQFVKETKLNVEKRLPIDEIIGGDGTSRLNDSGEIIIFTGDFDKNIKDLIGIFISNLRGVDVVNVIDETSSNKNKYNTWEVLPSDKKWILNIEENIAEFF
jgi:hypothetical protein